MLLCWCRALASHIPQEGDTAGIAPGSSVDEPVASASSSYEETPDGVQQWGVMDWPRGVPRRCSWRWRGALTGGGWLVLPGSGRRGHGTLSMVTGEVVQEP
jgi:hypothetical protein